MTLLTVFNSDITQCTQYKEMDLPLSGIIYSNIHCTVRKCVCSDTICYLSLLKLQDRQSVQDKIKTIVFCHY